MSFRGILFIIISFLSFNLAGASSIELFPKGAITLGINKEIEDSNRIILRPIGNRNSWSTTFGVNYISYDIYFAFEMDNKLIPKKRFEGREYMSRWSKIYLFEQG